MAVLSFPPDRETTLDVCLMVISSLALAFRQNRQVAVPVLIGGLSGILNPLTGSGQQVFGFQNQTFQRSFQQRFPDVRCKGQIFAQGDASAVVRQGEQALGNDQPQTGKQRGHCRREEGSVAVTCSRSAKGKTLMMRLKVSGTERVCTVE